MGDVFGLKTQTSVIPNIKLLNSCIMGTSDLPDMYTQARGPLGPRVGVYITLLYDRTINTCIPDIKPGCLFVIVHL